MAAPWTRIRTEWLKGGTTYAKLAKKYKLAEKTIRNRAYKEGWGKEKGQIEDEARTAIHARVVCVREEQLQKLAQANGALIDALVAMAMQAAEKPQQTLYDAGATLRNAESLSKAIQLAAMTQRDLYRLPSMDLELKKKAEAARKKETKEKLALEREKWEAEQREKAKAAEAAAGTVWEVIEPDGEDTDG
jgi:hypothetical protein